MRVAIAQLPLALSSHGADGAGAHCEGLSTTPTAAAVPTDDGNPRTDFSDSNPSIPREMFIVLAFVYLANDWRLPTMSVYQLHQLCQAHLQRERAPPTASSTSRAPPEGVLGSYVHAALEWARQGALEITEARDGARVAAAPSRESEFFAFRRLGNGVPVGGLGGVRADADGVRLDPKRLLLSLQWSAAKCKSALGRMLQDDARVGLDTTEASIVRQLLSP